MKRYFVSFFCFLLVLSIGTSCKSSDNTDKVDGAKTTTNKAANIPEEVTNARKIQVEKSTEPASEAIKKARENASTKVDERMVNAMMKRATALANTYCNCANSKNVEGCRKRMQGSYDATMKRLPEDKQAEFKASYEGQVASCK